MACIGGGALRAHEAEQKSLVFRRSIYADANIVEAEIFTETNIQIVRPGHGGPPALYRELLGRSVRRALSCGDPLCLDQLL